MPKKFIILIARLMLRGNFSYSVMFLLVMAYGLGDKKFLGLLYMFIAPWLLIFIIFFNIRFFIMLFKGFKIEEPVKINHSLEHGTIYFIRENAPKRKVGGSAYNNGFRVYGAKEDEIKKSFANLMECFREGKFKMILSKNCGTNSEIFSGISFVLLIVTFVVFTIYTFDYKINLLVMLINAFFYLILKYPLGRLYQEKITTSVNFGSAYIKNIHQVKPKALFEKPPVYFVETVVY